MSSPLRVAMVVASEYAIDARVRRQAEALAERGDAVTVISLGSRQGRRIEVLDGVEVIQVPVDKHRSDSSRAYFTYYARFAAHAARELLALGRVDLIQVHSMPEALVFCAVPQRLRGTPVLLDVHDLTSLLFETKFGRGPVRFALRGAEWASMAIASRTMTVHEPYSRMLHQRYGRVTGEVPYVVNVPDGSRWHRRPFADWSDDEVVFSFHGSLVHRYGVVDMVEALQKVKAEIPGARLLVRGGGDARDDVVRCAEELGLRDSLDISPGYVPLEQMPQELQPAHIGLAPYHLDPFMADSLPTKLLEFAVAGIPVVSSRLPLIEKTFGDSLVYSQPGDVASLADAMLAAARDRQGARERVELAAGVVQELSWTRQRDVYLQIVDRTARRRVSRRDRG